MPAGDCAGCFAARSVDRLGRSLADDGRDQEAIEAHRRAIELKPEFAEAYVGLGNALFAIDAIEAAATAFRRAIALKPGEAAAHGNLGNLYKEQGRLDEAIAAYREALALNPAQAHIHGNLILAAKYHPVHYTEGLAVGARVEQRKARRAAAEIHGHVRELHVGCQAAIADRCFAGFSGTSGGAVLLPLLQNHDRREVEVFAYAQSTKRMITQVAAVTVDVWRGTVGVSDSDGGNGAAGWDRYPGGWRWHTGQPPADF